MVLRDQGRSGDETEGELFASDGVSTADGSGDGVCDSCGGVDEPVLRRNGRIAAEVCVVSEEFAGESVARGEPETQRFWVVRRAGERVYLVPGEIRELSTRDKWP